MMKTTTTTTTTVRLRVRVRLRLLYDYDYEYDYDYDNDYDYHYCTTMATTVTMYDIDYVYDYSSWDLTSNRAYPLLSPTMFSMGDNSDLLWSREGDWLVVLS